MISSTDISKEPFQMDELYRNMVENARDGKCITYDGDFKYVNKSFCEMLGYTSDELYSMKAQSLLVEEDRERMVQQHYSRLAGNEGPTISSTRLLKKDGSTIHIEISASGIMYNGKLSSYISARDITERVEMEQKLQESEALYRQLIEKSMDGVAISQNQKILMTNAAFANQIGYTVDEIYEVYGLDLLAPEDKERVLEIHMSRMKGFTENARYQAAFMHKNGSRVILDLNSTTIQINNQPASLITTRDITELTKMQNELRNSEKRYRELTDLLPQTIFELDMDGNLTYVNKAGIQAFGDESTLIGTHASAAVLPKDRAFITENINLALKLQYPKYANEYTALRVDGSTFPVMIYGSPMFHDNELIGLRGLIVDISERKQMEEALRQSQQRYHTVVQSLQEGLFVIQNMKFEFVNDALKKLLGYSEEEIIGENFFKIIPPEFYKETADKLDELEECCCGSWNYEYQLLHKDGVSRIPVILSTNTTQLDGKHAVVGTVKDITDKVNAEKELKIAHARLEEINHRLEQTIEDRTRELTEANTQLLKLQKENLQSQFDVLKQQVNPHFLFNSLNVLISLIKLEPDLAEKFTEHLSKVYRYVLENKDNEFVKLSTELDFLDAYIFLLDIRFKDKLYVQIDISDKNKNQMIIPLAMQLLIENAIKHNSMSKKSPLNIRIFIDNRNYLNIINNLQERDTNITSTGVGLNNIRHRYLLIDNMEAFFEKTETEFIARIPLINS